MRWHSLSYRRIATTSLIKGADPTEKLNRLLDMFARYLDHDVVIDMPTFMSERATGHRNRAMAHLMLNFDMIDQDINTALDLYFQQCSVMVNCQDLAMMAAALAKSWQLTYHAKASAEPQLCERFTQCHVHLWHVQQSRRMGLSCRHPS